MAEKKSTTKKPATSDKKVAAKAPAVKVAVSKPVTAKDTSAKPIAVKATAVKTAAAKKTTVSASASVKAAPAKSAAKKAAAKTSEKSSDSSSAIGLFQYFLPKQPATLKDAGMVAIKAPDAVTPLTHPSFIRELLAHPQTHGMRVWGMLPADYPNRLVMTGEQIRTTIESQPGFDVYTFNPHPEVELLYENLWVQGEVSHPEMLALCAEVFKHVGLKTDLLTRMMPADQFVTGQAVVGTAAFWQGWLSYLTVFLKKTDALPDPIKARLYRGNADPKGRHANSTYLMFVIERLMAEYLAASETRLKIHRVRSQTQESKLNSYLKDIAVLRQMALNEKKPGAMRKIWAGYRQLYLLATQGKDWVEQNAHAFPRPSGAV